MTFVSVGLGRYRRPRTYGAVATSSSLAEPPVDPGLACLGRAKYPICSIDRPNPRRVNILVRTGHAVRSVWYMMDSHILPR